MQTREWTTIDKSNWGPGPWQTEPDKKQWRDEATGLACLIVRGPHGALCGYVGVPEGHPAYGISYWTWSFDDDGKPTEPKPIERAVENLDAHGGLTFSGKCRPEETEATGICHIPGPGEPDHVWWLGFDCAHAGDFSPESAARTREYRSAEDYKDWEKYCGLGAPLPWGGCIEYRTAEYVAGQCRQLAEQLSRIQGT